MSIRTSELFMVALCARLIISSYNSIVYSSNFTRDYVVFSSTEAMLRTNSTVLGLEYATYDNGTGYTLYPDTAEANTLVTKYAANQLDRLENQDCINAYATMFPTTRSSLVLIVGNNETSFPAPFEYDSETNTIDSINQGSGAHPFDWICNGNGSAPSNTGAKGSCMTTFHSLDSSDWRPFGQKVEYCLSETVPEQCEFMFVPQLAAIVILFNIAKILILLYIFFALQHRPLITIGDAVASFIRNPDSTTDKLCLMGIVDLQLWNSVNREPQRYNARKHKWSNSATIRQWSACFIAQVPKSHLMLSFLQILGLLLPSQSVSVSFSMDSSVEPLPPRSCCLFRLVPMTPALTSTAGAFRLEVFKA